MLRYAARTPAGPWTLQTIDASWASPGCSPSIPPLVIRLLYDCFRLAEFSGSAWSIQTVVTKSCGGPALVAYDQAGTVYAAT